MGMERELMVVGDTLYYFPFGTFMCCYNLSILTIPSSIQTCTVHAVKIYNPPFPLPSPSPPPPNIPSHTPKPSHLLHQSRFIQRDIPATGLVPCNFGPMRHALWALPIPVGREMQQQSA